MTAVRQARVAAGSHLLVSADAKNGVQAPSRLDAPYMSELFHGLLLPVLVLLLPAVARAATEREAHA